MLHIHDLLFETNPGLTGNKYPPKEKHEMEESLWVQEMATVSHDEELVPGRNSKSC